MAAPDIDYAIRRYNEAQADRTPFESDWRAVSSFMGGRSKAAWQSAGRPLNTQLTVLGQTAGGGNFDSTGMRSLPKYQSIIQRMLTPDGMRWVKYRSSNKDLMKIYDVRKYYDDLTNTMFQLRYDYSARFVQTRGQMYGSNGMYGCMPARIGWRKGPGRMTGGFAYKAMPLRDVFICVDNDDRIDTIFWRFYLKARQFKKFFPDDTPPKHIADELAKPGGPSEDYYEFVQMAYYADTNDYDEHAIDIRRHPVRGVFICIKSKEYVGGEQGYRSMPLSCARTGLEAGDIYGTSPAMRALPAMGGASATKKSIIKSGQKAIDPVLLANDDGVLGNRFDNRPGRINYGGVDREGRMLVRALDHGGNFNPSKEILADDRSDVEDSFYVTIFKILEDQPDMKATVAVELIAQKTALLAPTMGECQAEDLGPWLQREIDLVTEYAPHRLPEMPPELIEANGEYELQFTSPMARGLTAEEDAGFMRMLEISGQIANVTQDPSVFKHYNLDVALPELAEHMSVPARWMATPDEVAAADENIKDQQQTEMMAKVAAPAASVVTSMMKPNKAA